MLEVLASGSVGPHSSAPELKAAAKKESRPDRAAFQSSLQGTGCGEAQHPIIAIG